MSANFKYAIYESMSVSSDGTSTKGFTVDVTRIGYRQVPPKGHVESRDGAWPGKPVFSQQVSTLEEAKQLGESVVANFENPSLSGDKEKTVEAKSAENV